MKALHDRWHAPLAAAFVILLGTTTHSQTSQPVTEPDPMKAIDLLRNELVDSFNKGDVDRLLSHLDPDVVITWQNGEVCRGPQAVKAYYDRMMTGESRVVRRLSAEPVVDDRHIYGDWGVSWGNLHDQYELNDGSKFKFDSRFTATLARRGDAWKVTGFHASVNAFDNPVFAIGAKKIAVWSGMGGAVLGVAVGAAAALIVARRKRAAV
jgi:ketosteroid isomerase-like protein